MRRASRILLQSVGRPLFQKGRLLTEMFLKLLVVSLDVQQAIGSRDALAKVFIGEV